MTVRMLLRGISVEASSVWGGWATVWQREWGQEAGHHPGWECSCPVILGLVPEKDVCVDCPHVSPFLTTAWAS